jgi:hypothetical protein
METIQQLMELIGSKYVFKEENYPAMKGMTEEQKKVFALNHSILHMQKSIGKLAEVCEKYDHTGEYVPGSMDQVSEATVKMVINSLKLAQEIGFNGFELSERVQDFYKK